MKEKSNLQFNLKEEFWSVLLNRTHALDQIAVTQ